MCVKDFSLFFPESSPHIFADRLENSVYKMLHDPEPFLYSGLGGSKEGSGSWYLAGKNTLKSETTRCVCETPCPPSFGVTGKCYMLHSVLDRQTDGH